MTASERLIVRGPEDILGFIPHSLGYWPASSLVAMTLHGTSLGATLRLDLPGPQTQAGSAAFARTVRRYLESDRDADGALLAVFTSDAGIVPPSDCHRLISVVQAHLEHAGMPVRDAWLVGREYWRNAWCSDGSCCPLPGRPVQEIRDSMLNAEMVYRGSSVGPAPGAGAVAASAGSALHAAAVLEAQTGWEAELGGRTRSRAQFHAVLGFWEMLLGRVGGAAWIPDVERDGFLRATLLVPAWRDAVMVMAAAGRSAAAAGAEQFGLFTDGGESGGTDVSMLPLLPPAVASRQSRTRLKAVGGTGRKAGQVQRAGLDPATPAPVSASAPAGYGDVLMGVAPSVPDWAAMDALDGVLRELAVPGGPAAAAALTVRGWVAWSRGRGSYSAAYLGQALELEPGYRLAELLLNLVGTGTLCGWAARKEAAWQKFHDGSAGGQEAP